jgi:hypothetical protein
VREDIRSNRGSIRLLCSPRLAEPDALGIISGYRARSETELSIELRRELDQMLGQPALRNSALLLACLISSGALEVQLATVAAAAESRSKRMVHDKVGVFYDGVGNRVGFRGTFNETFLGLAAEGNIESVDVWTSWEGGKDANRLRDAVERFERIWNGKAHGITTRPNGHRNMRPLPDSVETMAEPFPRTSSPSRTANQIHDICAPARPSGSPAIQRDSLRGFRSSSSSS